MIQAVLRVLKRVSVDDRVEDGIPPPRGPAPTDKNWRPRGRELSWHLDPGVSLPGPPFIDGTFVDPELAMELRNIGVLVMTAATSSEACESAHYIFSCRAFIDEDGRQLSSIVVEKLEKKTHSYSIIERKSHKTTKIGIAVVSRKCHNL